MIRVTRTAPLLTVQDAGRFGYRADGVTTSGPMDATALAVANGLVGNARDAAALEGCLGGAQFEFTIATTFALTGADVTGSLNSAPLVPYAACHADAGAVLTVERVVRGAIWYLAVRGGIDVPLVLGSRSTLVSGGLGGLDGGPVRAGATLPIGVARSEPGTRSPIPEELLSTLGEEPVGLVSGPRAEALSDDEWSKFFDAEFRVSRASSRVGYRLEGHPLPVRAAADLASEPACAGAMQLPPEGQPIVLMADHPTVGGYPMIGVVPAHALRRLAQRPPGAPVRFRAQSLEEAVASSYALGEILEQWLAER